MHQYLKRPAVYLQCNTEIDCSIILFNIPSSLTSLSFTISRLLQNTQYFAKLSKGKSEKEYIYYVYTYYTHVHNNYFAVHLTLTQHCISTILQFKIKSLLKVMVFGDCSSANTPPACFVRKTLCKWHLLWCTLAQYIVYSIKYIVY